MKLDFSASSRALGQAPRILYSLLVIFKKMDLFQYTIKQIHFENKRNEFESKFIEIKEEITIYKKQFQLTTKSYQKEWRAEFEKSKIKYQKNVKEGEEIYRNILKDNPNDINNQMYADHMSNLRFIHGEHIELEANLEKKYRNFLDLFSKSILIALHSLFENKLIEIVELTSKKFQNQTTNVDFDNLKGFLSSIKYLNQEKGIDRRELDQKIPFFKDIKFLRNKIVHQQSKIRGFEIETISNITNRYPSSLKYIKEKKFFKILTPFFLEKCIDNTYDFYHQLFIEIEKIQNFESIKNQLKYWLCPLDNNILITTLTVDRFSIKKIKLSFWVSSTNEEFTKFKCIVELQEKDKVTFYLTCNNENVKVKDFFKYEKENKGYNFSKVFRPINISFKNYKTKIHIE